MAASLKPPCATDHGARSSGNGAPVVGLSQLLGSKRQVMLLMYRVSGIAGCTG